MSALCGAKTRTGGKCRKPAGFGTEHVGTGSCKFHGGSTPNGIKAARKEQARQAVETYGLPREVDPHTALLEELHRTAGHVAWLGELVAAMESPGERHEKGGTRLLEKTMFGEQPHVLLKLYKDERAHLAAIAKVCVSVGIEERRVQLAEEHGRLINQVLRGVLGDLGVLDQPEVPEIVRRHLAAAASLN